MYATKLDVELLSDDEGLNKVRTIPKTTPQAFSYLFWGEGATLTTTPYPVELTFKLKGARMLTASK